MLGAVLFLAFCAWFGYTFPKVTLTLTVTAGVIIWGALQ